MKIVADENIPYVRELFGPLGETVLRPGREINATDLSGANILLVRSVTPVNESLLQRSRVEFVGTCTIGCDHLDADFLHANNIDFASAPGCNANAVVQYVISVITHLGELTSGKSVVVVGGGNVGSRVYKMLSSLGFSCRCVDPFLDKRSGLDLVEFSAVYDADIVCLHAPYTEKGEHPTKHMFTFEQLSKLKHDVLLINAGRGGVIDNHALLEYKSSNPAMRVVLDVWENEPDINADLLACVSLGTPHIAGYSFEGRVTGSLMIFDALCRYLDVSNEDMLAIRDSVTEKAFGAPISLDAKSIDEAILKVYDVSRDFDSLKSIASDVGGGFDALRKNYPKRREYSHYLSPTSTPDAESYRALGFCS